MIASYSSISEITASYDAFIIDLWGVIHDGREAYPGVAECLSAIKQQGKKIIFLSNAPRRAVRVVEVLERLGIGKELYDNIITSGEAVYDYIKSGEHGFGKKFSIIGPERDSGLIDGLGYEKTTADKASFAIVTGFDNDEDVLEDKLPEILEIGKYNLPLICANPDMYVVRITGVHALCAGVLADHYNSMGGKSIYFGKPYDTVYQKCFKLLSGIDKRRIAAIGDNLDTDIEGANAQGIDSYLIAGGILGQSLGISHGQLPDIDKLYNLCQEDGNIPTGVLPAFRWSK